MVSVMSSLDEFVGNVTRRGDLAAALRDAVRAELGSNAPAEAIENRANWLMVESLSRVGINPKTEEVRRNQLFQILRGDVVKQPDIQGCVEYILYQMVLQPKAALAECLAIGPCMAFLNQLKATQKIPNNGYFTRSAWSCRLDGCTADGKPIFGIWREAADGLFLCPASEQLLERIEVVSPSDVAPSENSLFIFGVAEVKCFKKASRNKLQRQLDMHIVRLANGLQFKDPAREKVVGTYPPDQLWYAALDGEKYLAASVQGLPFHLRASGPGPNTGLQIEWTHPVMSKMARLTVGPCDGALAGKSGRRRRQAFDANLPYRADELEDIGIDMALYTLGAMGDDTRVDLPGAEWGWNLEMALNSAMEGSLTANQLARRSKILKHLGQ